MRSGAYNSHGRALDNCGITYALITRAILWRIYSSWTRHSPNDTTRSSNWISGRFPFSRHGHGQLVVKLVLYRTWRYIMPAFVPRNVNRKCFFLFVKCVYFWKSKPNLFSNFILFFIKHFYILIVVNWFFINFDFFDNKFEPLF